MSAGWVWAALDLAPTRDADAIRRAYAVRLKLTHPEDDAQGFQTLRAAYEQALAHAGARSGRTIDGAAQRAAARPPKPDPHAPTRFDAPALEPDLRPLEDWDGPKPESEAEPDRAPRAEPPPPAPPTPGQVHDSLLRDLWTCVVRGAEATDLIAAFNRVIASPAMDDLAVEARTEAQIADLIAHNAPNSDPLIEPAVQRFRWRPELRPRPSVDAVLRRRTIAPALSTYADTRHPMHVAFKRLLRGPRSGPYEYFRGFLVPGSLGNLRKLLIHIDRYQPALLPELPQASLFAWRRFLRRTKVPPELGWVPIIALALVLIGLAAPAPQATRRPAETIAAGPGRVVAQCRVNAQHGLSDCRIVSQTAPEKGLGPRTLDFLQRRVRFPSPTVPVDAQYLATVDYDADPRHDPKIGITSVQAAVAAEAAQAARTIAPLPRGPGRVVMACRVSAHHGLERCGVVSEAPKGRGFGSEALSFATRSEGWLAKAPVGIDAKAYVDFPAKGPWRLRATWLIPSRRAAKTGPAREAEPTPPPSTELPSPPAPESTPR